MPIMQESGQLRAINQLRGQLGYRPYAKMDEDVERTFDSLTQKHNVLALQKMMAEEQGRPEDFRMRGTGLNAVGGDFMKHLPAAMNGNRQGVHDATAKLIDEDGNQVGDTHTLNSGVVNPVQPKYTIPDAKLLPQPAEPEPRGPLPRGVTKLDDPNPPRPIDDTKVRLGGPITNRIMDKAARGDFSANGNRFGNDYTEDGRYIKPNAASDAINNIWKKYNITQPDTSQAAPTEAGNPSPQGTLDHPFFKNIDEIISNAIRGNRAASTTDPASATPVPAPMPAIPSTPKLIPGTSTPSTPAPMPAAPNTPKTIPGTQIPGTPAPMPAAPSNPKQMPTKPSTPTPVPTPSSPKQMPPSGSVTAQPPATGQSPKSSSAPVTNGKRSRAILTAEDAKNMTEDELYAGSYYDENDMKYTNQRAAEKKLIQAEQARRMKEQWKQGAMTKALDESIQKSPTNSKDNESKKIAQSKRNN